MTATTVLNFAERQTTAAAPSRAARREEAAFTAALIVVLAIGALRLAYGATLPMTIGHFGNVVRATAGILLLLVAYPLARREHLAVAMVLRGVGLGYLFSIGIGPTVKQIYYTGRNWPLADGVLAGIDHAMGFDWLAYVERFRGHPHILAILDLAYNSIRRQPFLIGIGLAFRRRPEQFYAFVCAQDVCILLVTVVTIFVPALGSYHHAGATLASLPFLTVGDLDGMAAPILALRAGDLSGLNSPVALVQFPSYHAAAAVLYVWAAWKTPFRIPILVLDVLMLLATPILGSHYLADMIAGIGVAGIAIVVVSAIFRDPRAARCCGEPDGAG